MNRFSGQGVQNTLEQYIPLPFQEMMQAGQAYQQRGDIAEQKQQEVELGLSSMEALAGEHQKFRDSFVSDYRKQSSELLNKSGLNTSDPEFVRSIRKLTLQFASDPRLQVVKQANEKIKQNDQIAAKMQAEGKLFIKPQFSGADDKGNLNSNVGNIEGVNTLDEWTKLGGIAHASIEDNGKGWKTNKGNLDRWKKAVINDVDGQNRLVEAYMTSKGYSREQAQMAVKTEMQAKLNQYGIVSDRNYEAEKLQLAYSERNDRRAAKAAATTGNNIVPPIKAPSFNEFTNRVGSVGTVKFGNESTTVFGSGNSQYGTSNVTIKDQKISGNIYNVSDGQTKPVSTTIDVLNGTLKGYSNIWVNKKDGTLLQGNGGAKQQPKIEYINGKPHAFKNGKPYEIEERTVAQYDYKTDKDELKTFYKEAVPKEAMREMGYSNAYYRNMTKPNHGSITDSRGKAKLDYQFIVKNISNDNASLVKIKAAETAFNNGTATDEQKQILEYIGKYDNRKSIYDEEIVKYFEDQSKTSSIVKEN